jgi:eukaryotic-like serine/threonine-protein kinase
VIPPGTSVGDYEIVEHIGSGGMGEVYRGRDPRVGREVAIKILSPSFAADPSALARFEQEARVAGSLNHPNLITLFHIGTHDAAPYLAMELLEGDSLRQVLDRGLLPLRKALDLASQIARGLAAAHDRGVVHRDIKPDNIFVTTAGVVKILDFGLAKMTAVSPTEATVARNATTPGMILGTIGYMSPEQVRGDSIDARTDIFSFGAVLYELLSGRKAFQRGSAADTLSAILREDPPDLAVTFSGLAPVLDRLVRRCLEKNPADRYQSARDLVFDLELIGGGSRPSRWRRSLRPRWLHAIAYALLLVTIGVLAARLLNRRAAPPPSFRRVTFGRGAIGNALFTPGGETFVYNAAWGADRFRLYEARFDTAEARPIGLEWDVSAISRSGEMAIEKDGLLARVPIIGGTPRPVAKNVSDAWWLPDGKQFAVQRRISGRLSLENPLGHTIFTTSDGLDAGLSRDGKRFAVILRPGNILGGTIAVIDSNGSLRELSKGWNHAHGIAWSPDDREIWFTAARVGSERSVWAVDLEGTLRLLARVAGALSILDVAPDGRALMARMDRSARIVVTTDSATSDLSWLDYSRLADVSPDGRTILFTEQGEGGGDQHAVYLRPADGAPPIRLGDGIALALSPDGTLAATVLQSELRQIILLPAGAGETRRLPMTRIQHISARWHPDGKRLIVTGNEPGQVRRSFVEDLNGQVRAITPPDAVCGPITIDGHACLVTTDTNATLYPVDRGSPEQVRAIPAGYHAVAFAEDDRHLLISKSLGDRFLAAGIHKLDLVTGKTEPVRTIAIPDPTGAQSIDLILTSKDGRTIAFGYRRFVSDLYLAEGLK